MQSFTTQSHQRNYQGNVIFPTTRTKNNTRRHQMMSITAIVMLVVTFVVMGSLLGMMTVHNQRLTQKIQTLETQAATIQAQPNENRPQTVDPAECITQKNTTQQQRGKTLQRIPISQRQEDTEPMPSIHQEN